MILLFFFYVFRSVSIISLGLLKNVPHLDFKDVVHFNNGALTLLYPCKSSTECSAYRLVLPKGKYIFETWGANGGDTQQAKGGIGGYSYGEISLDSNTNIYINIGGTGTFNNEIGLQKGGFNGGGDGLFDWATDYGAGAGGSTDIRLIRNTIYNRVIVAGGGGGAGSKETYIGGNGGGVLGDEGFFLNETTNCHGCVVSGGNQTNAGISQLYDYNGCFIYKSNYYNEADFWNGGSFLTSDKTGWGSGGGGGGWYGGARGCVHGSSGAGGSGFAFTMDSNIPEGYSLNSQYQMINTSLLNGGSPEIPSPLWNETQNHDGNGAVRITSLFFFETCSYKFIHIKVITLVIVFILLK